MWDVWKKAFYKWENTTAQYLETVLKNPLVLGPSGKMLSMVMKGKAKVDEAAGDWWGSVGLPTKRDQERTLHALNQMQSRLIDLEEELHELKQEK